MAALLGKAEDRVNKKIPSARDIFVAVFLPGLIASWAPSAYGEGISKSNPSEYHIARAKYYQDMAMDLSLKAKEQAELLDHYEEKSYLYGKRAQDLQAHTWALMRKYQRASRENFNKAADHRRIGTDSEKNNYFSSRQQEDELTSN
jgi:hypothetical protein